MRQTVLRNNKGVTLVEVMISLVILLVVFMGLIQASLLSIETTATNALRDEAVRLATETLTALKSGPFTDVDRNGVSEQVSTPSLPLEFTLNSDFAPGTKEHDNAERLGINTVRSFRNMTAKYVVDVTIDKIDDNNKQATVEVLWEWKDRTFAHPVGHPNGPYTHRVVALLRQ